MLLRSASTLSALNAGVATLPRASLPQGTDRAETVNGHHCIPRAVRANPAATAAAPSAPAAPAAPPPRPPRPAEPPHGDRAPPDRSPARR